MNQTQWKKRGWWLSIEINKKPSGKKNHTKALNLLDMAPERYDLLMENGKTMARGIFTPEIDMHRLAGLLATVNRWADTVVYSSGRRLDKGEVSQFTRFILCAAKNNSCRSGNTQKRLDYFGCPLMKIGLINYSLKALKNGAQYWFSFFKRDTDSPRNFHLDKNKLANTMRVPELCPLFSQNSTALLDLLPVSVNLADNFQRQRWVLTKYRFRTRWSCRFPPIVPNSESIYRQWMKNLIGSNGVKNERD